MKRKILFMGSGRFAVEVLKNVVKDENVELVGVVTQTDKPVGRKKVLTPTLVGAFCIEKGISCSKADNPSELIEVLNKENFEVDFTIVADYGVILTQAILDYAKIESLNVHGSILPIYRGASPVQATLLNNDRITGVSIITMTKELDAGPIWLVQEVEVDPFDEYESLLIKLGEIGGQAVLKVVNNFERLTCIEQDHSKATYVSKIKKSDGEILVGNESINSVVGKSKAYSIWPGIYFYFNRKKFELVEFKVVEKVDFDTKQLFYVKENKDLYLRLKDGFIQVLKLKPEGKNVMNTEDFLRGNLNFFGS